MTEPFKYWGREWSSQLAAIKIGRGVKVPRDDWRASVIRDEIAKLPEPSESPVYIATGGGYGSNNGLIDFEKHRGNIAPAIPSIRGMDFRDHKHLEAEKPVIRDAITKYLGENAASNPHALEQTLFTFYSDEVNTKLAKEVVKAAIEGKRSVIYESPAISQDTISRAQLAKENGVKTVLVAGDMALEAAIPLKKEMEPYSVAACFKMFATRFESELAPLFDEIRLYDTDQNPPQLIAEKKSEGQPLDILNPERYAEFLAKKDIDPEQYKSSTATVNSVAHELSLMLKGKGEYGQKGPDIDIKNTPNLP